MNIKEIVSKFNSQISILNHNRRKFCTHPDRDFTRNRKLSFSCIVRSILSFGGGTLTNEILKINHFSSDTPTSSAFIQQRNKISPAAFYSLLTMLNCTFDRNLRYKGYRLMAVDGSHVHVPSNSNDKDSFVKCKYSERPHNEFHLNTMFDILQGFYADAVIQKYRTQNEDRAMIEMVERASFVNAIIICDRGYESYNNMAHLQNSGCKYVIRIKEPGRYGIAGGLTLPDEAEYDVPVNLSLTRRKNKQTKELLKKKNRYRYIPQKVNFDYLPTGFTRNDPVQFFTLDFRIVRIKVNENSYELLVTNLSADEFSSEELKKLYAMRWGIETSFRKLKYITGMLTFHCRKSESVMQEIYASLIMYNMTQFISGCVQIPGKERKYEYIIRFSVASNIAKSLLLNDISPPDAEILIRRNLTPVRPNRSYSRKPRAKAQIQFIYRIA